MALLYIHLFKCLVILKLFSKLCFEFGLSWPLTYWQVIKHLIFICLDRSTDFVKSLGDDMLGLVFHLIILQTLVFYCNQIYFENTILPVKDREICCIISHEQTSSYVYVLLLLCFRVSTCSGFYLCEAQRTNKNKLFMIIWWLCYLIWHM
jgi:hypothetical protein